MTNQIDSDTFPPAVFSLSAAKERVVLAALACASIILPVVSVKTIGFSQSAGLPTAAGGIAYLLPLAFGLALAAPYVEQLRPHSRLIDIASTAIASLFVLWGLWELFEIHSTMAQSSAFAAMTTVTPSIGALTLVMTAALSGLQLRKLLRKPA